MRRAISIGAAVVAIASCQLIDELFLAKEEVKATAVEPAKAAEAPKPVERPTPVEAPKPVEPPKPVTDPWATPTAEAAVFDRAAERVTADLLRKHVEALASDDLKGRPTPSAELDRAADMIAKEYARLVLEVTSRAPEYRQKFECGAPGAGESANVVALYPGKDVRLHEEFIVVSAHYDHIGTADGGDDTIFNGANDNASGVAAMLAIAEVFSALDDRPRRSVLFVAFCGEEVGLRGSTYFAEDPVVPLRNIVVDLNLEMLGRPGATTPKRVWITGMPLSTLGDAAVTVGKELGVEFVDGAVVGPTEAGVFERSDNYPLARAGVVAHSFSTGALDSYYHHVDDESAMIEYDRMVPIVKGIARVVWRLAQADATPQWSATATAAGYAKPR
jgi:hypothetical protein